MRSNIWRTWVSANVPVAPVTGDPLLELTEEEDERPELLRLLGGQALERRHRRRGISERLGDRVLRDLGGHVRELRPRAVVAVLADLVTGQAARLADHELALVEQRERL